LKVVKIFLSRPRPRLFFVLEAPRDQDFGLEDYITDAYNEENMLNILCYCF